MTDQAAVLRRIVQNIKKQRARDPKEGARMVCVTSGKGGVGKTNFTVNLAIALSRKGLRTLILDADFGLSNVDVIMGVAPLHDLSAVLTRRKNIRDIVMDGPCGVKFISGGSGVHDLLNVSVAQLRGLTDSLTYMEDIADIILLDTGAGLSANVLRLVEASQEVIVLTTPEPTAIMDAYALIKTVLVAAPGARMRLVVNRAESVGEAEDTLQKFAGVVRLYLGAEIETLGYVLSDPAVGRAVRLQNPFVLSFPRSTAARNVENITWRFMNIEPTRAEGVRGFLEKLRFYAKNTLESKDKAE